MLLSGMPDYACSYGGPEVTAPALREWLARVANGPPYRTQVAVGRQIASINGKMRDELLDKEVYDRLLERRVLTQGFRLINIQVRPHCSLGYLPLAPGVLLHADPVTVLAGLR